MILDHKQFEKGPPKLQHTIPSEVAYLFVTVRLILMNKRTTVFSPLSLQLLVSLIARNSHVLNAAPPRAALQPRLELVNKMSVGTNTPTSCPSVMLHLFMVLQVYPRKSLPLSTGLYIDECVF